MEIRETQIIGEGTVERIVSSRQLPSLRSSGIEFAGVTEACASYSFARGRPSIGVVFACYGGKGKAFAKGRWTEFLPGQAYLAPPGVPHAYRAASKKWSFAWCAFSGEGLRVFSSAGIEEPELRPFDPEPLRLAVLGLHAAQCRGSRQEAAFGHWASLIRLSCVDALASGFAPDERLLRLWRDVDASPGRRWTLNILAKEACLSPEQLRALSVRSYGRSPMEQVRFLRMKRAAALLEMNPDLKLGALSSSLGYRNCFAFSVAFKRQLGVAPSHYAASLLQGVENSSSSVHNERQRSRDVDQA